MGAAEQPAKSPLERAQRHTHAAKSSHHLPGTAVYERYSDVLTLWDGGSRKQSWIARQLGISSSRTSRLIRAAVRWAATQEGTAS